MDCDIHLHVEQKFPVTDDWFHIATFRLPRDYRVFGALAGVRGTMVPDVAPRHMPTSISYTVEQDYERWGDDVHSESWLTPEEFHAALARVQAEGIAGGYLAVDAFLRMFTPEHSPVRVVFWFDS